VTRRICNWTITAASFAFVCLLLPLAASLAQVPSEGPTLEPIYVAAKPEVPKPVASEGPLSKQTDAERISRIERSVEADDKRMLALKASLTDPNGEYAQAEAAFRQLDAERTQHHQQLKEAEESGATESWARMQESGQTLEKKWQLAKERFDLAIGERKAVQESIGTLERKIQGGREILAKLRGEKPIVASAPAVAPVPPEPAPAKAATEAPSAPSLPLAAIPHVAVAKALTEGQASNPAVSKRVAAELNAARSKVQESVDAASAAEARVAAITERIELLKQDIEQQRTLRDMARKKVDNAEQTLKNLNEEVFHKLMAGEDIATLKQQVRDTTGRLIEARTDSRDLSTHLDELQSTISLLQSEQLAAMQTATGKRAEATAAEAILDKLEDPFTLSNIQLWLKNHLPKIALILASIWFLLWFSRSFETRLVSLIASRGRRGSREDRENRAKTLLGVFNNAMKLLILAGGVMALLEEVGIASTPFIGGAAVVGLAVAFGAQSLIKDYFTGFMVLFEQQYLINDVIKIGETTGQVERITLRMTVLRDMEGRVHFIPHGQINTVTNLTHGWSRAVFEIAVAYKEQVDEVIEILKRLGTELRQDENFRLLILDGPNMLGVDSLSNSSVIIKFHMQTRPLQQWPVKREMLRRIKNEFDRLGVEIPYPHLTIYQGKPRIQVDNDHDGDSDGEHWAKRGVA
jgi:small conductance mechanosensitive channel